ncbi:MAG: thiol oxidoreductase [Kofleriaceae bacterium]|nr:thiol oxidoreductase [Kofleriaceae bacterium]
MRRAVHAAGPALTALLSLGAVACGDNLGAEVTAGGATTVGDRTSNAFSLPAPGLSPAELARHLDGDLDFDSTFVTGDAPVNGGLGPRFNNTSCGACHSRDGRGRAVIGDGPTSQLLVRVSLPSGTPDVPGGAVPVPGMGTQLQDHAVFGAEPDARVTLGWDELPGRYGDGTPYVLRAPRLTIVGVAAPLPFEALTSLRLPPAVFGLGLLEAVDEADLHALADPDDADGDGISGRVNQVWDPVTGTTRIGRFGVKANTSDLTVQAAAAYANDMGIGNPIASDTAGGAADLALATVEDAAFYTRTLAVPAPTAPTPASTRGQDHFDAFGCAGCHVPHLRTGPSPIAVLADQDFAPYTDLLLHDLGDGLADGRPDFLASGREWRTPPLWGLGLVETVLPGATYLHDGRARTLAEAILWHGGEAEAARERFRTADAATRADLVAFLRSR